MCSDCSVSVLESQTGNKTHFDCCHHVPVWGCAWAAHFSGHWLGPAQFLQVTVQLEPPHTWLVLRLLLPSVIQARFSGRSVTRQGFSLYPKAPSPHGSCFPSL